MYLLLCLFSSAMAVLALSSWAAKQGSGFAVDELTGQITGIGDYRRAVVQAGAAAIGILVAILLSNIDYRSLVNVWPVHVVLTWGLVLPTLVIRNVTLGPLTIGYNDKLHPHLRHASEQCPQPPQRAERAGQAAAPSLRADRHHPYPG
jgi:rod shape determining protein RodA